MRNNKGLTGLGSIQFPETGMGMQAPMKTFPAGTVGGAGAGPTPSLPAQDSVWSKLANILLDKYLSEEDQNNA